MSDFESHIAPGGRVVRILAGSSNIKKKGCKFCGEGDLDLDYKNIKLLQNYLTEHGKIIPRRMSNICAFHQRVVTQNVKRARQLALLGYTNLGIAQQ